MSRMGIAVGNVVRVSEASSPEIAKDESSATELPLDMLHDRLLVLPEQDHAERHSAAGLVIPATAEGPKKLTWGTVAAAGSNVRQVEVGQRVLYDPEDRAEVEVVGKHYVLLREKDLHAVWRDQAAAPNPGLYL
ncbi:chaperonin GroES [Micrococcales bacterium KH10]|nr:chaperonin GroES [Micrococcales bacterium KH10]